MVNKEALVKVVRQNFSTPGRAVNALFKGINIALLTGREVRVVGFGTFKLRHVTKKVAWDFQTKKMRKLDTWKIHFVASRKIEELLNKRKGSERETSNV